MSLKQSFAVQIGNLISAANPTLVRGPDLPQDFRLLITFADSTGILFTYEGYFPGIWDPDTEQFAVSEKAFNRLQAADRLN